SLTAPLGATFFLHILNCFLLLVLQEVFSCPAVCQLCTGGRVHCRNLGLSSIPKSFPKSTVLIYLSGNNLSHVIPNELTDLQKLVVLYNPWNCSCKLFGLRNWLALSSISVKIHCQNPPSMRGRPLYYVKRTEFTNCASTNANPEAVWNLKPAGKLLILLLYIAICSVRS
uniref:Leucine rich repeat containing 70 n=1 Tax=Crocodylus porosus TaxID=8502 RepID=A0A7M4FIG2_CROPO